MNKKFGAFSSSIDPQEFSLTIASALKIIGTVVGGILAIKGINLSIDSSMYEQTAEAITTIATSIIAIYHSGEFIYGLVRKLSVRG